MSGGGTCYAITLPRQPAASSADVRTADVRRFAPRVREQASLPAASSSSGKVRRTADVQMPPRDQSASRVRTLAAASSSSDVSSASPPYKAMPATRPATRPALGPPPAGPAPAPPPLPRPPPPPARIAAAAHAPAVLEPAAVAAAPLAAAPPATQPPDWQLPPRPPWLRPSNQVGPYTPFYLNETWRRLNQGGVLRFTFTPPGRNRAERWQGAFDPKAAGARPRWAIPGSLGVNVALPDAVLRDIRKENRQP
jgi:hypothetical protein